jgi:hypothetical protein
MNALNGILQFRYRQGILEHHISQELGHRRSQGHRKAPQCLDRNTEQYDPRSSHMYILIRTQQIQSLPALTRGEC